MSSTKTTSSEPPPFDEDDIESMLQQLELGITSGKGRDKATQQVAGSVVAPPPLTSAQRGAVEFSTYSGISVPSSTSHRDHPLHRVESATVTAAPKVVGKLAPLHRGSVTSSSVSPASRREPSPIVPSSQPQLPTTLQQVHPTHVFQRPLPSSVLLGAESSSASPSRLRVNPADDEDLQRLLKIQRNSVLGVGGAAEERQEPDDVDHLDRELVEPVETFANINFLPVMHARYLRDSGGITPRPRWGHSLTAVGDQQLLMFGGTTAPDGAATRDLFVFMPHGGALSQLGGAQREGPTSCALSGGSWEPLLSTGEDSLPNPRYYHAAVAVDDRLVVIHGGKDSHGSDVLGDMHTFDMISHQWRVLVAAEGIATTTASTTPPSSNTLLAAFGHTAVCWRGKLYLFGGRVRHGGGKPTAQFSNDVFVFQLSTKTWRKRIRAGQAGADVSESSAVEAPCKRAHHAATLLSNDGGWMVIHGGEDVNGNALHDTWALDLSNRRWHCLHHGNTADAVPRSHHALFACGEAVLAVGGCARNSVTMGTRGVGRPSPFLSTLPVTVSTARDPSTQEVVTTPLSTGMWNGVVLGNGGGVLASRRDFGAALLNGFLFVFGGSVGGEQATNHMIRCLATDGVACSRDLVSAKLRTLVYSHLNTTVSNSERLPRQHHEETRNSSEAAHNRRLASMRFLSRRWDCDMVLHVGNKQVFTHRALLHSRAPLFFNDVLTCRFDEASAVPPDSNGDADTVPSSTAVRPPVFYLEGNSRVKGLDVPMSVAQLQAFLSYLYTASLDEDDATDGPRLEVLSRAATQYELPELAALISSTRCEEGDVDSVKRAAQNRLTEQLLELSESAAFANVTLWFVDPHTAQEEYLAVHSWVLSLSNPQLFHRLLRPLWTDPSKLVSEVTDTAGGVITARLSHKSKLAMPAQQGPNVGRRVVVMGPFKIPVLSIKPLKRFLYGRKLEVDMAFALHTMIAAHRLGLDLLQSACEAFVARHEVNFQTCCDFLTLARNHGAPLLHELCLVTAAAGFDEVKHCAAFHNLDVDERVLIEKIAGEIKGLWNAPMPSPPRTEQKSSAVYSAKFAASTPF